VGVVLAGGPPDAVAALVPGAANKAFVSVGGRPLVARVIGALATHPRISRTIVVAPRTALDDPALAAADERRPDGARMITSLRSGLTGLDPDAPALVAAADLPSLTHAALDELLAFAAATDADLAYACVHERVHRARYPQVPHTWARLREGRFCGGGAIVVRPRVLDALATLLDDLGAARKAPWRLARIFGARTLARYLAGALRIVEIEARASDLLGARVRAAISPYPEIALNVDRVADVARAEGILRESAPA